MTRNTVLGMIAIAVVAGALLLLGVALYQVSLPDIVTPEQKAVTITQMVTAERHSREVALWMAAGAVVLTGIAGVIAAIIANEIHDA